MYAADLGFDARLNRLMGGWRDIVEDTRRLRALSDALPNSCDCKAGGGRCGCCASLGHSFPDQCRTCTSHVRSLSPAIANVLDDTLRYLPVVESVVPQQIASLQRSLRDVACAMVQLLRGADAMQSATGNFTHGCRPENVAGLKGLVGGLSDAVEWAHEQLRSI